MKKLRLCFSAAVGMVCLILSAALNVNAFEYNGRAWCCDSSVVYCVNPQEPSLLCTAASTRTFVDVINSAASSWNGLGRSIQFAYGGTTAAASCVPGPMGECAMNIDGQNVVAMVSSCSFPPGVIASAWIFYSLGPGTECCILEADMCVSDTLRWYADTPITCPGTCFDLESVALHEFGHWLSLGHEDDEPILGYRPVMYSSIGICEFRRVLTGDDTTGLDYAYDATGVIAGGARCASVHSHPPYATSTKMPMFMNCSFVQCDSVPPCQPGVPWCDSTRNDPCLVVCPQSDITFKVIVKDQCGNPICDTPGTWLDFSACQAAPCPGQEPFWPRVYADSCDPLTGTHYFTVDAFTFDCLTCSATLFVNSMPCRPIPTFFLDVFGNMCVDSSDLICLYDLDCDGIAAGPGDSAVIFAHMGHCCGTHPCPPDCDSIITDPCLVVCPLDDVTFRVNIKDSCGNPICDTIGTWLEFPPCAIRCPGGEPDWPRVYPGSCDPITGDHFFRVAASIPQCFNCDAVLYVNGVPCRIIPTKYLDNNGDRCVTPLDFGSGGICDDLNCDGTIDASDAAIHGAHAGHCCNNPCIPTGVTCNTVTPDPCLLICPQSDVVYKVNVRDDCGAPVCDTTIIWLDFANCPAIPCPGEEPAWPRVFPDSCNPLTGDHYFTVDAGFQFCTICDARLFVNGMLCTTIPTRYLDHTGDLCVTPADFGTGGICEDFNCSGGLDPGDAAIHAAHLGHCCGGGPCTPGLPWCDSVYAPPCLLVCPESDAIYSIFVIDSCGNPVCDTSNIWLDFATCPTAVPCPLEEPAWPRVFPDSCDPVTGQHFFTVDASSDTCADCFAILYVRGQQCRDIPVKFLDNNGDGCVTELDWLGNRNCDDLNCDGTTDMADRLIWQAHRYHCCRTCDDVDADTICDPIDNCRLIPNPGQLDSDGDGLGDVCDNCPTVFNPGQEDANGIPPGDACCCVGIRGDANGDGSVLPNILDLNFMVNRIFRGGLPYPCPKEADVNSDGGIGNIIDLNFLVNYIFRGGPLPGPC